jgi:hypothetical protein
MTGLNTASLTAQQTFLQSVTAANSQMDSLTTLASAAGLGTQGTNLLTRANMDLVAALLPAAQGSTTLTATLYALAQRGGYTGADSFKQLAAWVANTKSPMQDLQGVVGTLTVAAGNLTTDVQNLSTALGQTLNNAMAQVILTESGGLKPMENLFSAIQTTGLTSDATAQSALALGNQYLALTGNVSTAHDEFITFTENALKLTRGEADALWSEISGKLTPAVTGSGAAAASAANQIDSTFANALTNIINVTPQIHADLSTFSADILATGNNSARTQGARAQLIADLRNSGLSAQTATGLVDGLQAKIDALHGKSVNVGVQVSAAGKAAATALVQGEAALHDSITFQTQGAAAGMLVSGGTPGKDSVLAMLMPGEVVVPTAMVNAGAVDHLRGSIPGFASGGQVSLDPLVNWASSADADWGNKATVAWAQAALAQFKSTVSAAVAKAAASVPTTATAGSSGGIIATMMKNMAAARGWTGAQWNALYAVEMAEAGFNMTATNPSSGAYGLAQFINGPSEYAQYGGNSTTATGQITGMLNYIAQRYGNPEAAWAHESAYHWYDNGGYLKPGYTVAFNGTGRPEQVVSPAQADHSASTQAAMLAEMRKQTQVLKQIPAGVGQHVGGAINGAAHSASFAARYPHGGYLWAGTA